MRASIVMPSARPAGGAEEAFIQLLNSRAAKSHHWQIFFLETGPLVSAVEPLCEELHVVKCGRTRELIKWWKAAGVISKLSLQFRSNLILGWMTKGHVYGGLASWRSGIPCDWFQMGFPERGFLDRASAILPKRSIYACSEYVAKLQRQANPKTSVCAVPLGVDLNRFDSVKIPSSRECRKKCGLPADRPIVGIVGRLQRWKGMHVLIEAMHEVVKSQPNALCVIVGGPYPAEPDYGNQLTAQIKDLHLESHVILAGAQTNVPEWMQAMDVFVHASDREPFGIVVVEALALGKAVIATKPGGPEEILSGSSCGDLFHAGDSKALADIIVRRLESPSGPCAMSVDLAYKFSAEAFAEKLIGFASQSGCSP